MIRVLIAEDMDLIRGALVELLDCEPDIDVVADVARGDQILPSTKEHKPDIAVIDIRLPELDGITAATALHEEVPDCRVVMLTALEEPGHVRRAAQACASGFLHKTASPEHLADTIRRVASDEPAFDASLMLAALDSRECPITARELEVLRIAA